MRRERVDLLARDRGHGGQRRGQIEAAPVGGERVAQLAELLLDGADAQVELRRRLHREGRLEAGERGRVVAFRLGLLALAEGPPGGREILGRLRNGARGREPCGREREDRGGKAGQEEGRGSLHGGAVFWMMLVIRSGRRNAEDNATRPGRTSERGSVRRRA
ncbi:MAG: hypothetical protein QM820_13410 [Minicystis sp.]